MEITERDIKRVEEIFFNGNGSFEDEKSERYKFISCIDKSIDVEACPGSGKTTSLLAKLYLLSEKMPFENGKGICVLTHTNVAIDEIKNRLGIKADRLFQYPNFFGTIQSFVDRYLAIPYYTTRNGKRPNHINSDFATNRLFGTYNVEGVSNDNLKKIKSFLYLPNSVVSTLSLQRHEENKIILVKGINGKQVEIKAPKNQDWSGVSLDTLYKGLYRLKLSVLKNSAVLSYDDAYFYAKEYTMKFPQIKRAISSRFSHVFIDEMQDTYEHQDEIINDVFDESVVVQRIGDTNQAILNDNKSKSAWELTDPMKITGSRRFSQPIADVLKTIALRGDSELTGSNDAEIPPYIISYGENQEQNVIEKFASIIRENNLDNDNFNRHPFKAVGWVGKDKEGLTIGSYFESFNKAVTSGRKNLANLKTAYSLCDSSNPREIYNTTIDCCLEILRISGIKNQTARGPRLYNKTSFIKLLEESYPGTLNTLNSKISLWGREIAAESLMENLSIIRSFFKNELFQAIEITLNDNAKSFIDSDEMGIIDQKQLVVGNVFVSETPELNHIPIEVATVHSVKGETHRATLYLETYFHDSCGNYLIDQLTGNVYNGDGNSRKEMCLKIAHVGMSRPTHLLCVALNKSLVDEHKDQLEDNGWVIEELT